ncbi:hypothetical protein Hdeb2414_s0016g00491761 [Helianthus debilis subsp. tardiflorus]
MTWIRFISLIHIGECRCSLRATISSIEINYRLVNVACSINIRCLSINTIDIPTNKRALEMSDV